VNQAVWSGAVVNDDSITQCVRNIRRTLGDEGQTIVKTVPRRGYVFAAKVTTSRDERATQKISNAATLPDKPSVAGQHWRRALRNRRREFFCSAIRSSGADVTPRDPG
jgi:DNA-binding winged helix-turn-helix (wHTH) protein